MLIGRRCRISGQSPKFAQVLQKSLHCYESPPERTESAQYSNVILYNTTQIMVRSKYNCIHCPQSMAIAVVIGASLKGEGSRQEPLVRAGKIIVIGLFFCYGSLGQLFQVGLYDVVDLQRGVG